ncbi:MAG: SAM-dependent methyltransferase [Bacteroidia bacterium]
MKGKLILIPNTLGDDALTNTVSAHTISVVQPIYHFVVESSKAARAVLKQYQLTHTQQELVLFELDKHEENKKELYAFLKQHLASYNVGVISDAGVPAVADPGNEAVAIAHNLRAQVVPLVGPSSILLTLMASGFNGQNFAFNGYLSIDKSKRTAQFKGFERLITAQQQTQLFIETPYRNNQLIKELCEVFPPHYKLCIAANITLANEYIKTLTIADWRTQQPDLHKQPCMFALYV